MAAPSEPASVFLSATPIFAIVFLEKTENYYDALPQLPSWHVYVWLPEANLSVESYEGPACSLVLGLETTGPGNLD